jgi:RNA polymerase sigma-70 factor (ECF subfamily)
LDKLVKLWHRRGHSLHVVNAMAASRTAEPDVVLDVAELHDEYADFVWRNLQRLGVAPSSLEDALQDVFVVVHRRLDSYDGTSKISTWLFGICLRVASAHRKRAHLKHELYPREWADKVDDTPRADPEQVALRREAERRLEAALAAMDLERRAVFVMFEIEGMPAAAIAELLGIPKGTVHSRLHKARAEFAAALTRQEMKPKTIGLG